MKNWKIAITLGILCVILTIAIRIQLKTMKEADSVVSKATMNNDLRNQVLIWKEKYETALKAFEQSEYDLENSRQSSTQNDGNAVKTEEQIKQNNILLGLTDVTGNGIIIKLEDNKTATRGSIGALDSIEYYLVHDSDLITIVNELWNAGAEAISINNQRIVSTSAITCEGNVIKVNGEKIGTPFEIRAIGSQELMYGAINRPGGYYQYMRETGVVTSIYKATNINIKKYTGVINSQYIKNK